MSRIKDFFWMWAGAFGLIFFTLSILFCCLFCYELSLIFDIIVFISLNPYITLMFLREKEYLYDFIPPIWNNSFGSLLRLIYTLNHLWFAFLIYMVFDKLLVAIIGFILSIIVFPKIYVKICKKLVNPYKDYFDTEK